MPTGLEGVCVRRKNQAGGPARTMRRTMASAAYPKPMRLRSRRDFQEIVQRGRVHPGRECLVRVLENGRDHPRLGIASPARFGNAIRRNRFRRLVREAFRHLQAELGGVDVMVSPRKGLETPTLEGLRADLQEAPAKARAQRRGPRRDRRR